MKKWLFFVLLTFAYCSFSQDTDEPLVIKVVLDPANLGLSSDSTREFIVKGSKYLNEKHQIGTIINGETKLKAPLRYNAYNDTFQALDKNNKKVPLLKSPNIKVELSGKTYEVVTYKRTTKDKAIYHVPQGEDSAEKQGYFCPLSDGQTVLYSKTIKKIPKLTLPESGYETFKPSAFVTIEHYYIKRKYKPATRIGLSKKEVLFALNNKYNEVRAFIKKHKLKVKTEEEVIQILSYYDTLN